MYCGGDHSTCQPDVSASGCTQKTDPHHTPPRQSPHTVPINSLQAISNPKRCVFAAQTGWTRTYTHTARATTCYNSPAEFEMNCHWHVRQTGRDQDCYTTDTTWTWQAVENSTLPISWTQYERGECTTDSKYQEVLVTSSISPLRPWFIVYINCTFEEK